MKTNTKLIKCDVTIDPEGKEYPKMHLQYLVETEFEKKLIDIPEAVLPLRPNSIIKDQSTYYLYHLRHTIQLDDNSCPLRMAEGELSDQSYAYAEKTLERYPRKMSVEEIEDKLGYPIEIVSKKKGDIS